MSGMKEYEKWLKPQKLLYDVRAEAGWRAALEWVKETMAEIIEHDLPISGEEVIKKELEGV